MSNAQAHNEEIMQISPNNLKRPEDINPTTEGTGENESTPFVKTQVLSSVDHSSKPVTLTFKDLSYSVQVKNSKEGSVKSGKIVQKEILRGMTGVCKSGELTAIMGASGAGKTTLLNILSCRILQKGANKLTGEFLANGNRYDLGKFSKFAGYVMQNDILFETMTPRETFIFTASLRLSETPEERTQKVNKLIQDLKLERAADTIVGGIFKKGISGGERKRTSIGVELITNPKLLFLDEPTSGLDSFTAFLLINLLKNLAVREGKTIIATIHQPSSDIFFLFDSLMILAKGKFLYQGPTRLAVDHFASIGYPCPEYSNPADYFMEITHSKNDNNSKFLEMYNAYDEKLAPIIAHEVRNVKQKQLDLADKRNGFLISMATISKRSMLNFLRNPALLKGRVIQTIFFTFLVSILYFQITDNMNPNNLADPANDQVIYNINGCFYLFTFAMFMSNVSSVTLTFPSERAVFLKEYNANMYSVSSYFFGKSSTELPFLVIFPIIMSSITYYIMGLNDKSVGKIFFFMLVAVLIAIAGNSVGIFIGCLFSDGKVAKNAVPAIMLPWKIFSGFYANSDQMPKWIGWLQYTSPFRYAQEAFMWNQYSDFELGTGQLDYYGYGIGKWGSLGFLVAFSLILRVLAWFALKVLVKRLQ